MLSRIGTPVPGWKRANGTREPNSAATMSLRGAACQFFPVENRAIVGGRENRREQLRQRHWIAPAKLDFKYFDPEAGRLRQPHPVFRGRHQKRAGALGITAQSGDFGRTEPVMIGK